jgi:hypothetical protein
MTGGRSRVKEIEGRTRLLDAQIAELMKLGYWDNQIRLKFKCNVIRLRKIRRALPPGSCPI